MKKIIKINLIILVIFCLSFSSVFNIVRATSEAEESDNEELFSSVASTL